MKTKPAAAISLGVLITVMTVIGLALGSVLIVVSAHQAQQQSCGSSSPSGASTAPAGSSSGGLNAAAGKVVARAAYTAGFRGDDLVEMTAVSFAESAWIPTNGNSTYQGLWAVSPSDLAKDVPGGNIYNPDDNAKTALDDWLTHLKSAPEGIDGGPDPTPGPFTGHAPRIVVTATVDGGLPLSVPEEPWQDWQENDGNPNYAQALAYLNANIGQWGLPAGWATERTQGASDGNGGGQGGAGSREVGPSTGGSCQGSGGGVGTGSLQLTPGQMAKIGPDGIAKAPADAPEKVKELIAAENEIADTDYGSETRRLTPPPDSEYDCSGSVDWGLYNAGLSSPAVTAPGTTTALTSVQLESYGLAGAGKWITVYAGHIPGTSGYGQDGHAWIEVAGIVFDTSHQGLPYAPESASAGARWFYARDIVALQLADGMDWTKRHPPGF
jgi:hypothetical protein